MEPDIEYYAHTHTVIEPVAHSGFHPAAKSIPFLPLPSPSEGGPRCYPRNLIHDFVDLVHFDDASVALISAFVNIFVNAEGAATPFLNTPPPTSESDRTENLKSGGQRARYQQQR